MTKKEALDATRQAATEYVNAQRRADWLKGERDKQALEARHEGAGYRELGDAMMISTGAASDAITRAVIRWQNKARAARNAQAR